MRGREREEIKQKRIRRNEQTHVSVSLSERLECKICTCVITDLNELDTHVIGVVVVVDDMFCSFFELVLSPGIIAWVYNQVGSLLNTVLGEKTNAPGHPSVMTIRSKGLISLYVCLCPATASIFLRCACKRSPTFSPVGVPPRFTR